MAEELQQSLVSYAAVASGNAIMAEYADGNPDSSGMALKCLQHLPPLHSRFSYTTCNRMFICLIEGLFIYCAIVDEALSKTKAFMFLEHVRDAFKVLLQQQGSHREIPPPYFLDKEMAPFFEHLAAPLVGTPQKEKDRIQEELQAQRYADIDFEISSPSAVAPLHESDQDFDQQTEQKPVGTRLLCFPWIGKGKPDKRKVKDQINEVKEFIMENSDEKYGTGKSLEVFAEGNGHTDVDPEGQKTGCMMSKGEQSAQKMWWRNVKLVIIVDVIICLVLLAVWLGVCTGVSCLKRNN